MEGFYDEYDDGELDWPRDHALRGPSPVMFSACLEAAPGPGEALAATVRSPSGVVIYQHALMEQCQSGGGRLWRTQLQLEAPAPAGEGAAGGGRRGLRAPPRSGIYARLYGAEQGGAGGRGFEGEERVELPALFSVTYAVVNAVGASVKDEKKAHDEAGYRLAAGYYHKVVVGARDEGVEAFGLFVELELHLLQWNPSMLQDLTTRFEDLCKAKFPADRTLLDKALLELIRRHWAGAGGGVPAVVVLAVAAMVGHMQKRGARKTNMAASSLEGMQGGGAAKHKPPPPLPPLQSAICTWLVRSWSHQIEDIGAQREVDVGDAGGAALAPGERPRRERTLEELESLRRVLQVKKVANQGLKEAAQTLYLEEKSFEWFRLFTLVDRNSLPNPLDASQFEADAAMMLKENFKQEAAQNLSLIVGNMIPEHERLMARIQDQKIRAVQEQDLQKIVQCILEGLFEFCPSVLELRWLSDTCRDVLASVAPLVPPMIMSRLRSINFGKEDKQALKQMVRDVAAMQSEETAVALLESSHHPSSGFPADEVMDFVQMIMTGRNVHSLGGLLVEGVKRWLRKHYSRPLAASGHAVVAEGEHRYEQEIKKAIGHAINGWELAVKLTCFEEFQVKMILFDLSQTYFFREPEPLVLIGCILDLEDRIEAISSKDLRADVITLAVRAVRGSQETIEELRTSDALMALLFHTPTPLRFELVDALVAQRNASPGLRAMVSNEAIWTMLFSPAWEAAKNLGKYNLGATQKKGRELMESTKASLAGTTTHLGDLHVIVEDQKVYCALAKLALKEDLAAKVTESGQRLQNFDKKLEQLGVFAKMFCSNSGKGDIDVAEVERLVEDVRDQYDSVKLKDALPLIESVLVWPHLDFLYSLRGSDVFMGIWLDARAKAGQKAGRILTQAQVVGQVIPAAQKAWESLAEGLSTGSVSMGDVRWVVSLEWVRVQAEFQMLESTTKAGAATKGKWQAADTAKAMRMAARLRDLGPAVLQIRQDLGDLFKTSFDEDPSVPEIKKLSEDSGKMWEIPFGKATALVAPYKKTLSMLTPRAEDFVLLVAKKTAPFCWLAKEATALEGFNGLIEVCRPNTDDPRVLGGIASMQQTRTLFADLLYSKPPYPNTKELLDAIGATAIGDTDLRAVENMQVNFDPLLELLTKKNRAPGVQACYDLKMLCDTGTFRITCTPKKSAQMVCLLPGGSPWHRQELADLRQQLLMTDVPDEVEGMAGLPALIQQFVAKCLLLEEYSHCTQELFNLGHFDLEPGQEILQLKPSESVAVMESYLQVLQERLEGWEAAVRTARGQHYYLNYFTVYELRNLCKALPAMGGAARLADAAWRSVWPALRIVSPLADEADCRKRLAAHPKLSQLVKREAESLGILGEILQELFAHAQPQVRPLEGLGGLCSDEQGDLLIRRNEAGETGVPIFVCTVEDATKVTEAVFSIYARRERVPEAEEVLLCSQMTTAEEIELLARRFITACAHRREEHVFCLGNTHLLSYAVQCRAAEVMRWLEERVGYGQASCLAVVNGGTHQQVLGQALLSRKAHAVGFPAETRNSFLREAVAAVGRLYHGRPIQAVAADINGGGKTSWILKEVCGLQQSLANGRPIYHRVELRETTDTSGLVEGLLSDGTDTALPTAIHINLAHILPSHVDTLLFQLLIVGVLHDSRLAVIYHRRPQDVFFIEIPNTPNEQTAKSLPFVMLLPRTFLKMNPHDLSYEKPVITEVDGALFVEMKPDTDLELLGKYLASMEIEEFNPLNKKSFKIDWTEPTAPRVEKDELYRLLAKVCCQENEPPSWLLFCGFKNFLTTLLKLQEKFPVASNLTLQKNLHFTGLKHSFIKLLIETARSFALRQIPKGNIDFEMHPLAPPAQTGLHLLRQISLTRETSLARESSATVGVPSLGRQTSRNQPSLNRETSRNDTVAVTVDELTVETSGVGRVVVTSYVSRFAQMQSWETMEHPVAYFVLGATGNVQGCQVMSMNPEYVTQFIPLQLVRTLELQGIHLKKDWSKASHQEAVKCVLDVEGGRLYDQKYSIGGPEEYVVTVDNLIKLMTIQQRLKYGLPVCLMGETGCGKTALVRFLAKTLEIPLLTLDVHGGITEVDIMGFIDRALARGAELPEGSGGGVLVFFDEVNAANCLGLFKTLICDRMHRGKSLPLNVRIVSCCNPYRQRMNKELEAVALTYEHKGEGGEAGGLTDPMRNLVYRVHPLPESLMDVVSDFGALSEKSEALYIRAILSKELMPPIEIEEQKRQVAMERMAAAKSAPRPSMGVRPAAAAGTAGPIEEEGDYDMFIGAFRDLLCCSQSFVREAHDGERSVVSMRDIARAVRVCKWFLTYYARLKGVKSPATLAGDEKALSHGVSSPAVRICVDAPMREHLRSAVILTLGYCYHARLARDQRQSYRERLCTTFADMAEANSAIQWLNISSEADFDNQLISVQYEFVSQMQLGEGIALNEALRENLFMLLVSIMNQIPILLVGKPGCSKSLAMDLLKSNLNGVVSEREFFRAMPAVEVFAYQCSPMSTPEAILYAFESARRSNIGDSKRIVCVLLDEVGLAEESPHLPLKVLHRELEHLEGIACVGISNWALDAAKMNRCVMLYRPPPTVVDLRATAEGMAGKSANLKGYLHSLSEAFFEIYESQRQRDFWGMREFYSTIRALNVELRQQAKEGHEVALHPSMIMKAVLRNFGGRPEQDTTVCVDAFFDRVGMNTKGVAWLSREELIKQNLSEPDARHLMLLTRNNSALRLLFETGLLGHQNAEVMFGGTFPGDQSDVFVAMNLQRVKTYMQRPVCLVMVHCDALYESLYDLLNQHYMEYAGQRYVRIAHGSMSKQCPIHKLFRIIVVVEEYDAYHRLAPPLLNRFEKQVFNRGHLMTNADTALRAKVNQFWEALLSGLSVDGGTGAGSVAVQRCAVAGFHQDLLGSLVFALRRRRPASTPVDDLFAEARRLLVWVLTPEAVCLMAARKSLQRVLGGFDIVGEYFKVQQHVDLPSFTAGLLQSKDLWCDPAGAQVVTMTYSPLRGKVGDIISRALKDLPKACATSQEIMLHELSSSQDLEKDVAAFYRKADMKCYNLLLIRADTSECSLRMLEYSRFVCEKARNEWSARAGEATAPEGAVVVVMVVHLERGSGLRRKDRALGRGASREFSFDFDSQWSFVFLDSIEPVDVEDACGLPALSDMLHAPLLKVLGACDFPTLLRRTFREALARLVYPHRRQSAELQQQVQQFLVHLVDADFITLTRDWSLHVLKETEKRVKKGPDNEVGTGEIRTVGQDAEWFADVAAASQELMLSGTLRDALHQRILTLVTSLLTVFMAHLDRNGGYALLAEKEKRSLWLLLATPTLTSHLCERLRHEAKQAALDVCVARREVTTDAQSPEMPFASRFPFSWFVSRTLDNLSSTVKSLPATEQLGALETQYKLTSLHAVGFKPDPQKGLIDDYLADFAAMHLEWMPAIDRPKQHQLLRAVLQRAKGAELTSILEIHCIFWFYEQQVRFCIGLVDAVPAAIDDVERLIQTAPLEELNAQLLLRVHRLLIQELLTASGDPKETYRKWLHKKMLVAGLTADFFVEQGAAPGAAGGAESPLLIELRSDTEPRIETLALYVRYLAYPMKLPCEDAKRLIQDLPNGQLRCPSGLGAVLRAVDRARSTQEGDAESALDRGRSFAEAWILDVCLRDVASSTYMEPYLARLFCHIATGLPVKLDAKSISGVVAIGLEDPTIMAEFEESDITPLALLSDDYLPRLPSFSLALLRKLVRGLAGDVAKSASSTLDELLVLFQAKKGHNDSVFSKDYAVVREENAAVRLSQAGGPPHWPKITLDMIGPAAASPARALLLVGHIRWMLTQYATEMCEQTPNETTLKDMEGTVQQVLCEFDVTNVNAPLSRSLRLFVMKTMERSKGVTFLRGALAVEPVASAQWVSMWRGKHDLNFEKFIGSSKVPSWTPFIADDAPQEFGPARGAVLTLIASQSTVKLEAYFSGSGQWPEYQRRRQIGAFLMALCSEPGMLAPIEEEGRARPPWREVLNTWLARAEFPVNPRERSLMRVFAGDDSCLRNLSGVSAAPLLELFSITGGRPMDSLFLWRYLGHLAATLLAAPPTSLLATLRTLMLEPENMMNSKEPDNLPAMDEDIRHRIQRAFGASAGYQFANHWYKCITCGNKFYIGECSKPMQEAKCPGCGAMIGGNDHRPTATTVQDETVDSSPAGYTLPKAAEDEKQLFFRDVHATSARAMRLLLHGAMVCGLAAQLPDPNDAAAAGSLAAAAPMPKLTRSQSRKTPVEAERGNEDAVKDIMPRVYGHITTTESVCTMHQEAEAVYLTEHLYQDWRLLAENLSSHGEGVAMGMHSLLQTIVKKGPDAPVKKKQKAEMWWDKQQGGSAAEETGSEWTRLSTLQRRGLWEETMDEKYLLPFIAKFEESILVLHKKWNNKEDESGPLVAELRETADVNTYDTKRRYAEMPQVLAYRAPLTMSEVQRRLPQAKKEYDLTLLSTVVQTHILETMKALRTLVGQFQWHSLAEQRFSGRITREEANELKIGDAIEAEPLGERGNWDSAYQKLQEGWHEAFQYVDRFECLEIPAHLKTAMASISKASPLSCAIADEKDLGICPLVLTQWLVARHNDLVQSAALAGGYPIRKISSRTMGHHDVVVYDKEMMMRFIRDRCVTHGPGGRLNLDLVELERHLRHEFAKPELSFHLRLFQWLGEGTQGSNMLKEHIAQRDLPPEVEGRLRGEIRTPVLAAAALQKLQMAATFIVNSRDSMSSDVLSAMKLTDYLSSVLAEPPDSFPSATARSEVNLCHVDAFVRLLKNIIHADPMETLPEKYKMKLGSDLEARVSVAAATLSPDRVEGVTQALLSLVDYLSDGGIDKEQQIIDWLEPLLADPELGAAVRSNFPAELALKHLDALYRALKKALAAGPSAGS